MSRTPRWPCLLIGYAPLVVPHRRTSLHAPSLREKAHAVFNLSGVYLSHMKLYAKLLFLALSSYLFVRKEKNSFIYEAILKKCVVTTANEAMSNYLPQNNCNHF